MIREGTRTAPGLHDALPSVDALLALATDAAARARAPYSGYRVGAAVVDEAGRFAAGCNVESGAYAATICAERGAVAAAIAGGAQSIIACVTVTHDANPASSCGVCRQLLSEFGPDVLIVNASLTSERVRWGPVRDWLPFAFVFGGPTGDTAPE